jgi:biotin/methionine sulfoxide reductase
MRTVSSFHWGAYEITSDETGLTGIDPLSDDPNPSPIGKGLLSAFDHKVRVREPMVRRGWLENGPGKAGGARGRDPFVPVSWDKALDLISEELARVSGDHGYDAIFAGNYGWSSTGRFHHAKSQLRRFMSEFGGFTDGVTTYSTGAAQVIIPHVFGQEFFQLCAGMTSWSVIARNSELLVMFGGIPLKNAQVSNGGICSHDTKGWLNECKSSGVEFVNISPVRNDAASALDAEWLAPRPNTDTAFMIGLAHTLILENLHDRAFLDRYTTGFDKFENYILGRTDGIIKDAEWAGKICDIDSDVIRSLARKMATKRTLLTASWSIQRGDHGEQTYWMLATLGAMIGQIGLPGGGVGYGYGAVGHLGNPIRRLPSPTLPTGMNPIKSFIPVARIADLLLNPGSSFCYNGGEYIYPDIKLVYWCGGNPFHHHQDINRLAEAFQMPETIVVHEPWWTATARHADIVLPANTSLERNDIGHSSADVKLVAMKKVASNVGQSRCDYDILSDLSKRLGFADRYTEGRTEMEWLEHMYDSFREQISRVDIELPSFQDFWDQDLIDLPVRGKELVMFEEFRNDPNAYPLGTPSGKIEIFSQKIDGFGLTDCMGHAAWFEPIEWLGSELAEKYPLHLVSNQPTTRLHSQLDCGSVSQESKVAGREPVRLNPIDALERNIKDGDLVRLFNSRGACLAGAVVSEDIRLGCAELATGAWYDPNPAGDLDRAGNPNVLTLDKGTSSLGQGSSAHTALVEVEKFVGAAPAVEIYSPPSIERPVAAK